MRMLLKLLSQSTELVGLTMINLINIFTLEYIFFIVLKENYIDSDEINKYPEFNLEKLQTELPLFKRESRARCLENAILYYNSCMENIFQCKNIDEINHYKTNKFS